MEFCRIEPERQMGEGTVETVERKIKSYLLENRSVVYQGQQQPEGRIRKIYKARKEYEQEKNENGDYADQAEEILRTRNIGKTTEAYKHYSQGKLPPGHIQQRAERYATKIFLSHLHEYWYEVHYGEKPPKPFAIAILGHAHQIPMPE